MNPWNQTALGQRVRRWQACATGGTALLAPLVMQFALSHGAQAQPTAPPGVRL